MSDLNENKGPFERRLAGYALACGAAVLGANQADAGIRSTIGLNQSYGPVPLYTDPNPTNILLLDVDGDANFDFLAANLLDDQTVPVDGVADLVWGIVASSGAIVIDPAIVGDPFTAKLSAGTMIDATSPSNSEAKLSLDTVPTPTVDPLIPWNAGASGFIGFSFLTNGGADTNFGWVNLEIGSGYEVILKGYGYEDVPLTGIKAGATPEPSSLVLLACGAAGVVALNAARKRRVSKSA